MERVIKERMSIRDQEQLSPVTLVNIRPVVAALREFFGSSQLSQFMDQTNRWRNCATSAHSLRLAQAVCAANAPVSMCAMSITPTMAVSARLKHLKARTSVLLAAWLLLRVSTSMALSKRPIAE
jgi:hypothetical protein